MRWPAAMMYLVLFPIDIWLPEVTKIEGGHIIHERIINLPEGWVFFFTFINVG